MARLFSLWDRYAVTSRTIYAQKESPYGCVDGQKVVDVPSECIRSRFGKCRGWLDLEEGVLHFDSFDQPEVSVTVHLGKVPALAAAPGNKGAAGARASFDAHTPLLGA